MIKKIFVTFFICFTLFFISYKKHFVLENTPFDFLQYEAALPPYEGIITYLINLDRSKGRLDYMMPKINKLNLPFQRISGVDGQKLTDKEIDKVLDKEKYLKHGWGTMPKKGTIGCSLSHINTWKTFLKSNYEYALILEDDVEFDPIALTKTIQDLLQNKNLWDINIFEITFNGRPLTIKKLSENNLVVYLTFIRDAGTYIISRHAAAKLIEKSLPIVLPIDYYFNRSWEFDLKLTGIEPRISRQNYVSSDIQLSTRLPRDSENLSFLWPSLSYQIQSVITRLIYNLKLWYKLKSS